MAITNSKFICEREEMQNIQSNVIVLKVIHQVGAISLDLLVGGDGAEDNLSESLGHKHAEANATDCSAVFQKS